MAIKTNQLMTYTAKVAVCSDTYKTFNAKREPCRIF